ncbi:hypothetical protein LOK49_Contig20G00009 [Camellia lanceoleosa]|nr:hypothetical protein LOK49_Contig20G00009 [Camellia lanceoleosa]
MRVRRGSKLSEKQREPIIRVLFERYAFDSAASTLVSSLFICCKYLISCLMENLLVVVFYALGDGKRPVLVSIYSWRKWENEASLALDTNLQGVCTVDIVVL